MLSVPFILMDDKDKSAWFLYQFYLENMWVMFKKSNGKSTVRVNFFLLSVYMLEVMTKLLVTLNWMLKD